MSFFTFIQRVLLSSSKIANQHFGKVSSESVKTGDNNQVLTQADLDIGQHLIKEIQSEFPDFNIIDEEAGVIDNGSLYTWVIDPIDGTSNFAAGLPTYGVMLGLLKEEKPIAGGIVLPYFQQLYIAEHGSGAFCNDKRVHVSSEQKLLSSLVAYGIDGYQENPTRTETEMQLVTKVVLNIRNLRTTNSAYDMVHVVDGRYGAFLNQTTKIWDNIAFHCLVEEAGGVITDFWGKSMDFSNPLTKIEQNFTVCAGAKELHTQLQAIIHSS